MTSVVDIVSRALDTSAMGRTPATGQDNDVRRARRAVDLTQAQLAEAAGVSRQTIVAVENGGYAPSVYLALALAEVLGETVESLFRPRPAGGPTSSAPGGMAHADHR
jgi:putative transcriptional regulator